MAAMTLPMVPPAFGVRQIRPSHTPRIIGDGYDSDLTPVQPEWIVAGRTRDDAEVIRLRIGPAPGSTLEVVSNRSVPVRRRGKAGLNRPRGRSRADAEG